MVRIATWNICLGLKTKKEYVKSKILEEKIDICCIQECEIKADFPHNILSFKDFSIEIENNNVKSRCCIYIGGGISYIRRTDLEGVNNNIVAIELNLKHKKYLLLNVYRSFAMQDNIPVNIKFATQINLISNAIRENPDHSPLVVGDFNLDYRMINNAHYRLKNMYESLNH